MFYMICWRTMMEFKWISSMFCRSYILFMSYKVSWSHIEKKAKLKQAKQRFTHPGRVKSQFTRPSHVKFTQTKANRDSHALGVGNLNSHTQGVWFSKGIYERLQALFEKSFFYSIAYLDETRLGKEFQGLDPCRNAKTQRQDVRNHRLQLNLQGREIQEGDRPI